MESNIFASFAFNAAGQAHPSDDKCIAEDFQGVKNCPERDLEDSKVCLDVEDLKGFGSAPFDWPKVVQAIRSMRASQDAPVDQMGTHKLADRTADEKTQQFQLLVAAVISSQTRDSVTAAAMTRLHGLPGGLTVYSLSNPMLTVTQLAEFLKPVGFYRQKAKHLKAIAETICGPPLNGCIPNTLKELLKLPGVGPKIALLVLWVAFGKEEGLIVDTNVRRVCCRLGWAPDGSDPGQVRKSLESWLPQSLWPEISFLFVGFGQQVCKPINPQCGRCEVRNMCPSAMEDGHNKTPRRRNKSK